MPDTNEKLPTREQIERRAYEKYVERGGRKGHELGDWLAAEKELTRFLSVQDKPEINRSSGFQPNYGPSLMFLEFYGLKEQPFGMTPDPAYLYASRTHSDALAALSLGIADNRGFLALIAEPGMGKTTLLYQLIEQLRDTSTTVFVFQTQCNSREFIEYILQDLGVDATGMGLVAMHGQLNEILFEELLDGKRFILVVDEAQNLDESVLETVRMLSNFETHNAKLMQIILAGQPQLAAKLGQPRLTQLRQRIAVLECLDPFTVEETGLYIEHRLKVAGFCGEPIFDPDAIGQIARQSGGVPRNINNICYHSLLLSHNRGLRTVTAQIVQEAGARLEMGTFASKPISIADMVATPPEPAPVAKVSGTRPAPIPAPNPQEVGARLEVQSVASKPLAVPEIAANPPAAAKVAKASASPATAIAAPNYRDGRPHAHLTYDPGRKNSPSKWPVRSAILVIILLSGTLLLAILGRSALKRGITPATFDNTTGALGSMIPADRSEGTPASYDAAPQEIGNGQVLTVVAGSQQSLKDLSLRYVGRFDSDLSQKILSLNPDLKDPDHLEAGQLIRIPLPPGAMRKVNDTAEAAAPSEQETSGSLYARLSAFLRERKLGRRE